MKVIFIFLILSMAQAIAASPLCSWDKTRNKLFSHTYMHHSGDIDFIDPADSQMIDQAMVKKFEESCIQHKNGAASSKLIEDLFVSCKKACNERSKEAKPVRTDGPEFFEQFKNECRMLCISNWNTLRTIEEVLKDRSGR